MQEPDIRDYINIQFDWLKRELENIRSALEKVSLNAVGMREFSECKKDVDEIERALDALQREVDQHEARLRIIASLGGATMGVVVMLLGAWLKALLGL